MPGELQVQASDGDQKDGSTIKPTIGIIYPPPEVRNIVDKTASFVARNGPEFETRIRQNEINNPKFNFLNVNDPYHAYYQHKVKEFQEGKGQEPVAPKWSGQTALGLTPQETSKPQIEQIVLKDPPLEYEFLADPPSISAFDLDIVKLTAQFVARNGRTFLTNLMNREQRNYQFDFLRPQHSLFNYFTKLVEQYTKILIPPKDLLAKLRKESENPKEILNQVKYRVEWAKMQAREKAKVEEAVEKERVSYAQIDWHDFVVVETVDFQANEQGNLPPPTTPEEVGARILAQERVTKHHRRNDVHHIAMENEDDDENPQRGPDDTNVQDMDEDSDEEMPMVSMAPQQQHVRPSGPGSGYVPPADKPPLPPTMPQPPPLPPTPDQVIVRRGYNPKAVKPIQPAPAPDQFLISPITGEKIPANKMQEHMRIGLLDPKWIEQRDRAIAEKQDQEEVYAVGGAIESSLKHLAERRTDIFGSGAEQAQIGKKIGEEDERPKDSKMTWDGHTSSMEKVAAKARENISIEEQIAAIHQVKGLLEDDNKQKIGPTVKPQMAVHPHPVTVMKPVMAAQAAVPMVRPVAPPMAIQRPGGMVLMTRTPIAPPAIIGLAQPAIAQPMIPAPQFTLPVSALKPKPKLIEDEPPSKKLKTEDSLLVENEWIRRHGNGPVMFKVSVPSLPDKPEWNLTGQTLSFSIPITDSVSVIKAKLSEQLGMPAGKQKLQYQGLFIKDSNTLAFYNFTNGSTVSLQLKERGGRKK